MVFLLAAFGFWCLGVTDLARAYIIPTIVAGVLLVFVPTPGWRAAAITTIAFLTVLLLVDGNAGARIAAYDQLLRSVADR